jgi:hypothetical protein
MERDGAGGIICGDRSIEIARDRSRAGQWIAANQSGTTERGDLAARRIMRAELLIISNWRSVNSFPSAINNKARERENKLGRSSARGPGLQQLLLAED